MAQIHIKDFDMHFGSHLDHEDSDVQPFMLRSEDSVAFLKLYLLTHS